VSILAVAMFGFLLSVSVVRYRTAWALGNLLEYPGWLLCGFLVPITLFPAWVTWISRALPLTWGMEAARQASAGDSPWLAIAACILLGTAYAGVAALLSGVVLRSARRHATLSLT
jgi:ABC-2 type transport system permease protein